MKVVVDTNVFINAFFEADKECKLVLRKEHNGEFHLVMCHDMNEELQRMLESSIKKFNIDSNGSVMIYKMLSRTLLRADNINTTTKFNKCSDKDDNIFFSCAIDGNANYIISKDKHIHEMKNVGLKNKNKQPIEILYPDEFIQKLDKLKLITHFNNK